MSEKPVNATAETGKQPDPALEMRGKLIKRLSMAGLMVGLLLGMLALFDYLAVPPDEPELTVYTKPVPVAPRKEVSQPVIASSNLPEPPEKPLGTEVAVPPAPEIPPVVADAPPAPVVQESPQIAKIEPRREKGPESRTPARSTASRVPISEPAAATSTPVRRPQAVQIVEAPGNAPTLLPQRPVTAAPLSGAPNARVVHVQPSPVSPSAVSRLFSGFVLQAGVFNSYQRAEELHAKLTLSGVPSSVETRVQVGPFKTRQEAEAAQARLRELGIETVMVAPGAARR